ncbi:Spermidine coumaroyl-coa acyltransferase [Thalictrum thalictroides]|uniref:Spermidine coumaroyl-coa acyltransferase n=1 Tax=Thalictrum thalictroides TaxID=46969 RepID=A0A7J6V3K1_THATH|nr:Spermidine coumaroyl-coa acyltransferase [Thalictrum thalictroides]
MAACIEPVNVHRKEIVFVKPSQLTPSDILSFSSVDNDPNLEILCQTIYVYRANEDLPITKADYGSLKSHNPSNKLDPACVIQEALSKVLVYYYPLAGKLKRNKGDGKLEINCTGEGVPFLVATADCTLQSLRYFDGNDVETAKLFVFEVLGDENAGTHPLLIQVTKFACGGFTIGMGLSHSVCDGFGAAQFFRAMAEYASGKVECTVKPVWARERLVGRVIVDELIQPFINKDSFATSPFLPTTDLVHECFNLSSDTIRTLKLRLIEESGDSGSGGGDCEGHKENFTVLEALSAYIWRARFKALELNLDGKTTLALAFGIRSHLQPPLPNGYYGNAFVSSNAVLMGKDLLESPLSRVAMLIKEGKKNASKTEYIHSWLDILESTNLHRKTIEANGAFTVLTDWRQLGLFEQVDFGWNDAVNVIPIPWKMFGYVDLCIFLPPCKLNPSLKGGVRVLVCLPRTAMSKFKEEMDAINLEFEV